MNKERLFWFLMCSLAAVGSLLIALQATIPYIPERVTGGLGEAFVVAAILGSTVDLYTKRRLTTEIAKDVSPFMMGHWLPQGIKDELRVLLQIVLYRTNVELEYELETIEGYPDYVLMTGKMRYNMENLSETPQRYNHSLFVERTHLPGLGLAQIRRAGIQGLGEGENIYEDGNLGDDIPGTRMKKWTKEVMIPPTEGRRIPITCYGEIAQILMRNDTDPFYFLYPSIGVRVSVRHPEDMQVQVSFGHRNDQHAVKLPPLNPHTWELNAAFLPFQSVMVEWTSGPPPTAIEKAITQKADKEREGNRKSSTRAENT